MTEVNQPDKAARRRRGKTGAVDAEAAARPGRLDALAQAVAEGVDIRGYYTWSLLDNYEWAIARRTYCHSTGFRPLAVLRGSGPCPRTITNHRPRAPRRTWSAGSRLNSGTARHGDAPSSRPWFRSRGPCRRSARARRPSGTRA
ncbi:family 1 glycosylhydrolase [Kitasatospora sp. MAA19]|uniref:family 1 glycosylhydrolase n=1 Tax=Kitasatospora sp. MAA19 TaxID=3035090 RepID=UPI0024769673|nr:family 1 glycosylhydrolase [Kitasatospora sp. MAA19]